MELALLTIRLVLAATFTLAAIAKLFDRQGSRDAISSFGLPIWLARPLSLGLPPVELVIAVLLLVNPSARIGSLVAFALLLSFTVAIAVSLARGKKPDCHCFGQLHSAPVGRSTLVRNALLLAGAGLVIWRGRENHGFAALQWTSNLSRRETATFGVETVLLLMVVVGAWLIFHLFRQHGRLLLRLDQLESKLAGGPVAELPEPLPGTGLPIGSTAPSFELPLLSGDTLSLFRLLRGGKPVLLLFSDPNCVPCDTLLPQVAHWEREHADKLVVVLVTRGLVEENLKKINGYELKNVLLQQDREVAEAYGSPGTPSAVLVYADGSIGSHMMVGPEAVAALATHALAMGSNGHHGNGQPAQTLKIGERAPEFRLPDLSGRWIELSDFKGHDTLVLFWNPACRFCDQMLPALREWEANKKPDDPDLVVVSTGSAEINTGLKLRSTVVLDDRFGAGQAFRASGTPSAVLIDGEGRIASDPVMGASEVLALASRSSQLAVS
jgi:peroxiredoxin/uncharacterized membrane protein YphA (DoxX/SURF4 family)